jgi:hypothetical protein
VIAEAVSDAAAGEKVADEIQASLRSILAKRRAAVSRPTSEDAPVDR